MSVVNQMLQDLERKDKVSHLALDSEMDPVLSQRHSFPWLGSTLIIVILCLLSFVFYETQIKQEESQVQETSKVAATLTEPSVEPSVAVVSEPKDFSNEPKIKEPVEFNSVSSNEASATDTVPPALVNGGVLKAREVETVEEIENVKEQLITEKSQPMKKKPELTVKSKSEPHANTSSVKQISEAQIKQQKLNRAEQLINQKNYMLADEVLNELIEQHPDLHQAREQKAFVLMTLQNDQAFESFLLESINRFPFYTNYKTLLARYFAGKQQWSKVVELADESRIMPETLEIMIAVAHQQLQQHNKAIDVYARLLRNNSQRGDWWMGLAISLEALKRFSDAHQALKKAMADPRLNEAQRNYIQHKTNQLKGLL